MIAIYVKYVGTTGTLCVFHWVSVPRAGDHLRLAINGLAELVLVEGVVWGGTPRECNVDLYVRRLHT